MSRLDSVIRRLRAQRACLQRAVEMIRDLPGPVLELGLGNGRTYDHLRQSLPDREIFVFEREVAADPGCLPDAAHLLHLLTGQAPGELHERALDASLILYAEHEFNASTFAARIAASTLSDFYSAITSGIGTLRGPLHGGANEAAFELISRFAGANESYKGSSLPARRNTSSPSTPRPTTPSIINGTSIDDPIIKSFELHRSMFGKRRARRPDLGSELAKL